MIKSKKNIVIIYPNITNTIYLTGCVYYHIKHTIHILRETQTNIDYLPDHTFTIGSVRNAAVLQ